MEKLNRLLLKLEKIKAIQNSDLKGIVFYAYDPDRNVWNLYGTIFKDSKQDEQIIEGGYQNKTELLHDVARIREKFDFSEDNIILCNVDYGEDPESEEP